MQNVRPFPQTAWGIVKVMQRKKVRWQAWIYTRRGTMYVPQIAASDLYDYASEAKEAAEFLDPQDEIPVTSITDAATIIYAPNPADLLSAEEEALWLAGVKRLAFLPSDHRTDVYLALIETTVTISALPQQAGEDLCAKEDEGKILLADDKPLQFLFTSYTERFRAIREHSSLPAGLKPGSCFKVQNIKYLVVAQRTKVVVH